MITVAAKANDRENIEKEELLEEMKIRVGVFNEGIQADATLFHQLDFENKYQDYQI